MIMITSDVVWCYSEVKAVFCDPANILSVKMFQIYIKIKSTMLKIKYFWIKMKILDFGIIKVEIKNIILFIKLTCIIKKI